MVVACPRNVIGVAVEPKVGIYGDTQRFKSIRNDQVTASDFDCRDVGGSPELVPCVEDDDLRFVSVKNHSRTADEQTARRSRAGVVSLVFIAKNSCVSSANWWYDIPCDWMRSPTGDTYAVKSSGPRTKPCGTPHWYSIVADEC